VKRFWEHYPRKFWVAEDWQAWEKAGRPHLPPEMDSPPSFEPALSQSMGVIPPPGPQPSFGLFPKPRRREATTGQSRAVAHVIEKALGPRSR
jgi:hypothetical protein